MKNIANADRPKSAGAMLPPRPLRGSGKVAQTACNSDRREGKSFIPTLNQTFADSRILKISKFPTFRIADGAISGPRQFVGRSVREVFPELDGQGIYELLDGVFATGKPVSVHSMPIGLTGEDADRYIDFI